ncbi:MAG TPA: TonB-dependent receptor [Terriglobales bacterium]|nr:TonB-dependent receptor [Terriglobales bacterium]
MSPFCKLSTRPSETRSSFASIRLVIFALAITIASAPIFAQTIAGFGKISGVVQDQTSAVVPGARVTLDNAAKGIHRQLETSAAGVFDFNALIPASGYTIAISKQGFQTFTIKDITVKIGEASTFNALLSLATSETSVSVTAETTAIDTTKVSSSSVVDSTQILDLPINGRRVDSFVLLTPGVTNDAAFGLLTFRGNPGGNTFLTDGNDTTNSFYDENAGRTRTFNISQDAVQEFQVVSSNFLAEYGHASGGVVNTVTRSGSNSIHGSAYEFFRNRTLSATDPTTLGVNPPEWRHQAGLSIGGPIHKDKLFYFFNGELQRRNAPIVSTNFGNNLYDAVGNLTATCGAPATSAQCASAISYINSRAQNQLVPRTVDVNLLFGKIDYHLNDRNSFAVSSNYLDFRSPNGIQTQLSLTGGNGIGNNANTTVFDRTGSASWTFVASPTQLNEFRFGYFKDRQFDPLSPSLTPSFGPLNLTVNNVQNLGFAAGYPRLNPSEQRFELMDTYSWTIGKHSVKYGVNWDHVEDYVDRLGNRFGSYSYPTLTAFAQDFSGTTNGKHWTSFSQDFGNPIVDVSMPELSVFVQDEWHLTPKLTITPGLRYEHSWIPQPTIFNAAVPQTGRIPNNGLDLAPRFGIAYALSDKTAIRAGYGIFYNRFTTSAIENLFLTNLTYQASYSLNGTIGSQLAAGPAFPNNLSAAPNVNGSGSIMYADDNWRNPYSQQGNLGIQHELASNTTLDLSYVWSRTLHLQGTMNANLGTPSSSYTYNILNASGSTVGTYTTPVYLFSDRINKNFNSIFDLQSNANSYYNGLLVNLATRYKAWFQGNIAYTWSHTIDDGIKGAGTSILFGSTFPTSYANGFYRGDRGSASTDQRHRLTVNAVFAPTFSHADNWTGRYLENGWQLSVISVAASSQPLQPTISMNSFNAPTTAMFSTSTLNGLGGSFRVPFESTSALDVGRFIKTDARIVKQFPITERVKLNLGFEAFNVFNHLIVSGSSPRQTQQYVASAVKNGGVVTAVNLVPFANYGLITATQMPPDGTTARRAQLVARFLW